MPVITIEGPVLSLEKKEKLCKEITALASEIMEIPKDVYVVFIKENRAMTKVGEKVNF